MKRPHLAAAILAVACSDHAAALGGPRITRPSYVSLISERDGTQTFPRDPVQQRVNDERGRANLAKQGRRSSRRPASAIPQGDGDNRDPGDENDHKENS